MVLYRFPGEAAIIPEMENKLATENKLLWKLKKENNEKNKYF